MPQSSDPRLELTTVRGCACLALVAYHIVGLGPESGMHLPESSGWHYATSSLDFLRMPLFTVLSGFLYAAHRVDRRSLTDFLRKKAVRLLAPLLFVTLVMVALRRLAYGDDTALSTALLYHYQHLWFLQALAIIFVTITVSDSLSRLGPLGLLVAGFGCLMVSRSFEVTPFFSLNGAFYLAPYFLFGMILRVERGLLYRQDLLAPAIWIVVIVMVSQQATNFNLATPIARTSLPAALCGCAAAYAMLKRCPRIVFLERIGAYSFSIYLWHSIASASVRTAVERFFALPQLTEFLLLTIVGVTVPIAIHLLVARIPILCALAAGLRKPAPLELPHSLAFLNPRPSDAGTWRTASAPFHSATRL